VLAKELYSEFASFLENKADIVEDKGRKDTISTGIDLVDAILGGGFAVGALNIIVGQPGSGKSMLAIQTLGQGQRQHAGKLIGGFLDSEEATTKLRLSNLGVRFPQIRPYADITVEKVFKFIEGLCVFKNQKEIIETPSIIVWDSIANTLSQKERETDDPNTVIGYKARLLSILVPKYVAKCAQHNICLLAVNQLRDVINMGMFAPPKDLKFMSATKDMPGGNVLKFNAFQLVEMKVKTAISLTGTEKSENYGFEGIIVTVKCVKNKLFPPNVEVPIVGSFTTGFSNFWTNYNFLKQTKRLNAGAWNYLISLPEKKFRTKDAPSLYKSDSEFKNAFDKASTEAIKEEIIDKYNPDVE
jgi:RecA/RadA recombinase